MKYNEKRDEGYFLKVDVQYPEKLHELHNDLLFLPERIKLGKIEMFVTKLRDKTEYVIYMTKFKTSIKSCTDFEENS